MLTRSDDSTDGYLLPGLKANASSVSFGSGCLLQISIGFPFQNVLSS